MGGAPGDIETHHKKFKGLTPNKLRTSPWERANTIEITEGQTDPGGMGYLNGTVRWPFPWWGVTFSLFPFVEGHQCLGRPEAGERSHPQSACLQ